MPPNEWIAELEGLVRQQRQQLDVVLAHNAVLQARVQELEARLAKDSHNSGKPPASDGLARRTKSLRKRSGKQAGGQIGHRGQTLRLVATPDVGREQRPTVCTACHAGLPDDAPVVLRERRQVPDVPPARLVVRAYQALHVRGSACATVRVGVFPPEASSRVQYGPRLRARVVYVVEQQRVPYGRVRESLADLFGAHLALGTLVAWVRQGAATLAPVEAQITAALCRVPVLQSDETGVRCASTRAWAHVGSGASTARLTHSAIHAKRGRAATEALGMLPRFTGVSVHDGWAAYHAHTACRRFCHALCTSHHLRELTFLEEQYHQTWAKELKALLREMKGAVEQARAAGHRHLPSATRTAFVARYRALLATGHAANPPPASSPRRPRQRGRVKQTPAQNLLERLWLGQDQVLGIWAFLDDLTIPFDNNQAERDLRLLKVQQQVSGCLRADSGAVAFAFARLRGYLCTLRKQGHALLAAWETLFTGSPLSPAFA